MKPSIYIVTDTTHTNDTFHAIINTTYDKGGPVVNLSPTRWAVAITDSRTVEFESILNTCETCESYKDMTDECDIVDGNSPDLDGYERIEWDSVNGPCGLAYKKAARK